MNLHIAGSAQVIGLSLSRCIESVIRGHVHRDNVIKIISATCVRDDNWAMVFLEYRRRYWYYNPAKAEEIVRDLLAKDLIEQSRLINNEHAPDTRAGIWVTSESQIMWLDRPVLPFARR